MQRGQLKDLSSWMARLLPEPFDSFNKTDTLKMFNSKSSTSTSTFYTDLEEEEEVADNNEDRSNNIQEQEHELNKSNHNNSRDSQSLERQSATSDDGNSQDSDSVMGSDEHQHQQQPQSQSHQSQQQKQSFTSNSFPRFSFSGFPRFQSFIMSTSGSSEPNNSITTQQTTSIVQMTHSVLEYRSSRYIYSLVTK